MCPARSGAADGVGPHPAQHRPTAGGRGPSSRPGRSAEDAGDAGSRTRRPAPAARASARSKGDRGRRRRARSPGRRGRRRRPPARRGAEGERRTSARPPRRRSRTAGAICPGDGAAAEGATAAPSCFAQLLLEHVEGAHDQSRSRSEGPRAARDALADDLRRAGQRARRSPRSRARRARARGSLALLGRQLSQQPLERRRTRRRALSTASRSSSSTAISSRRSRRRAAASTRPRRRLSSSLLCAIPAASPPPGRAGLVAAQAHQRGRERLSGEVERELGLGPRRRRRRARGRHGGGRTPRTPPRPRPWPPQQVSSSRPSARILREHKLVTPDRPTRPANRVRCGVKRAAPLVLLALALAARRCARTGRGRERFAEPGKRGEPPVTVDRGGRAGVGGAASGAGRRGGAGARPARGVVGGLRGARRPDARAGDARHPLPGGVGVEGGERVRSAAAGGGAAVWVWTPRCGAARVGVRRRRRSTCGAWQAVRRVLSHTAGLSVPGYVGRERPIGSLDGIAAGANGGRQTGAARPRARHDGRLLGRRVHGRGVVGDRDGRRAVRAPDAGHGPAAARDVRELV